MSKSVSKKKIVSYLLSFKNTNVIASKIFNTRSNLELYCEKLTSAEKTLLGGGECTPQYFDYSGELVEDSWNGYILF